MSDSSAQNVPTVRIVVSRERFDSVPRKRALYIGLYVVAFVLWAVLAFVYLRLGADASELSAPPPNSASSDTADPFEIDPTEVAQPEPIALPPWARVLRIIIPACIAVFYIPFVSVLRIMGYPWVAVFAFCGFALAPIPGLLIVAYMDTRMAKAWNTAELSLLDAAAAAGEGS